MGTHLLMTTALPESSAAVVAPYRSCSRNQLAWLCALNNAGPEAARLAAAAIAKQPKRAPPQQGTTARGGGHRRGIRTRGKIILFPYVREKKFRFFYRCSTPCNVIRYIAAVCSVR